MLSETFGYGVTHIDVKGYYKNSKQTIIYFAVNQFQIARMKSIIEDYDPRYICYDNRKFRIYGQ